jgi:uncharacterized protein (UPF0332 family)
VQPGTAIFVRKAVRAAAAAHDAGAPHATARAAFYAALYAAKALLNERGVRRRSHARIVAALVASSDAHARELGDWLATMVAKRRSADPIEPSAAEAAAMADAARRFVERVCSSPGLRAG